MATDARGPSARIPNLRAFRSPHDPATVLVHCGFCRRTHRHGAAGILDQTNPHRLAHCGHPRSPYASTGYNLYVDEPRQP